jgi:hypothetical protein
MQQLVEELNNLWAFSRGLPLKKPKRHILKIPPKNLIFKIKPMKQFNIIRGSSANYATYTNAKIQ